MNARVDQLEADVRKAVRLGWATFGCSLISLALKLSALDEQVWPNRRIGGNTPPPTARPL